MYTNYAIRCHGHKPGEYVYYIGRVKHREQVDKRMQQHREGKGKGAEITSVFKPVDGESPVIRENQTKWQEDDMVYEWMEKYGVDNVFGGTHSTLKRSETEQKFLQRKILSVNDQCYHCGSKDHFAHDCKQIKDFVCFRCGEKDHMARDCPEKYAPTSKAYRPTRHHGAGKEIKERKPYDRVSVCGRCNRKGHTAIECAEGTTVLGAPLIPPLATKERALNAYKPWTDELDRELWYKHRDGASVSALANHFQRSETAIQARLEQIRARLIEGPATATKPAEGDQNSWCIFM